MKPKKPDPRLRTPLEGSGHRPWDPQAVIAAPLQLHQTRVLPEWVDYNGHMSESCYLLAFGDSTDAFFRFVGIDETYRDVGGHSFYTVETHLHNLREVALAAPLRLSLQLLDMDDKRVHLFHAMQQGGTYSADHSPALAVGFAGACHLAPARAGWQQHWYSPQDGGQLTPATN
jgi:carnitine 3-dehydrogenase